MYTLQPRVCISSSRSSISPKAARLSHQKASTGKPYFREIQEHLSSKLGEASNAMNSTYQQLLDSFVDHTFTFKCQPLRPTESNFAPVDEIGEITRVIEIEGEIPADFPEGVYIRNGGNPLYGALQSVSSIFGQSHNIWVEGEGMLHAVYFCKSNNSTWSISYNNRYVQSETFRIEKERQKPCFLPMTDGNPPAMLIASVLNTLRFRKVMKSMSNTSVFEHAGRVYAASEDDVPHEVDLHNLSTLGSWHLGGEWKLPFTAHPKVIPGSKEMVIFGINAVQPFLTVGIISEDGEKLKQKVGLKLDRCTYCHEIGVTGTYNIIIDSPLTLNPTRMLRGAPVLEFEEESYSRIGVMPHYGDADSVIWFYVEPFCTFHLVNCFEEGHEVVVRGFHVPSSAIMGPRQKNMVMDTSSQEPNEENFSRLYEWRLNLKTRTVAGKYLTSLDVALEFPVINDKFSGLRHRYAYVQVADCSACFGGGHEIARPKFIGFAKLCLEEKQNIATKIDREDLIKVEYHQLAKNQFCSGVTFVPKAAGAHEDDGWIVSFVHDEETNISKVHIIDARNFESEPIAKIILPQRVPYGLHGAFITKGT
ncbi:carotenoid 9,10(9',10')-cleavage dioxygenase 1-like [Oryza glaberrima]|uniref:carotenoid 9,10(9',10')-cleavage dioxygenase 1-like n=1 Tax=Oryza glaberrima TaxID=4538 RepID=UPI00224C4E1C|nr:carotenoid 9,10(9',10')-cleavage dioxygenase 1-like [Oryza glaberrima]